MHNLAAEHPEQLEELKGLWFYYAGIYKGLPLDDRTALEIISDVAAAAERAADRYVYYPDSGRGPGVGRGQHPAALVHDRRGGGPRDARGRGRALRARRPEPAATRCTSRTDGCTTSTTGSARTSRPSAPTRTCPGRATSHGRVPEDRRRRDDESAIGTLTLYVDTEDVGSGEIMTQPGCSPLSGDGAPSDATAARRSPPTTTAPFPFTGGTIERVVIDVSGDHYVDHEKEVLAYLARD